MVLGWRRELRNRVAQAAHEASERNWDGYHAEPVTALACDTARRFVNLLPESVSIPDIVPTTDGEIAFEWERSSQEVFTVATNQDLLLYAGILGPDRKQYGQEPFGVELPQSIAKILGLYFSKT